MITGSIVALVTPMLSAGELDWDALARLIEHHIVNGTNAIVAVGTTGESATLDFAEHATVLRFVVEKVNGRISVIAGTGANSTKEAIHLTRQAHSGGADACLLVAPYYNKPSQNGILAHYTAIADAVQIPQILYNVPGRTVCDIHNDTALQLAEHENIVGIKDATGDLKRGRELIAGAPDNFAVYSGDDGTAVELILSGAAGNISVTANVCPKMMSRLCRLALEGESDAARTLQDQLQPLHRAMFLEANPIPVKWALTEMGIMEGGIRLPLTPLQPQYHQQVRDALRIFDLVP